MGNLNENPREGFAIVAACTMGSRHTSQEEKLLKLEHSLATMNVAIQKTQSLNLGVQTEHRRIEALVTQPENIIPRLIHEVEISFQRVNTVMSSEERMRDFEASINEQGGGC